MKQKPIALTGPEIERLVNSGEFRSRLATAARITNATGYEAGFRYFENYKERGPTTRFWESVLTGTTGALDMGAPDKSTYSVQAGFDVDIHTDLLSLHTHIGYVGLGLSDQDIAKTLYAGSHEVRPTDAIATVTPSLECNVLVMQRVCNDPGGTSLLDEVSARSREHDSLWPDPSYAQAIMIPGFVNAAVLRYSIRPRSQYATIETPSALDRFGN